MQFSPFLIKGVERVNIHSLWTNVVKEVILVFFVKPGDIAADYLFPLIVFLSRFRLWCQKVIGHKMFDHIILLFIFLNCITIALERPDIQPKSMVVNTRRQTSVQLHVKNVNRTTKFQTPVIAITYP